MRDFYLEQTRLSVTEAWDDAVTVKILAEKLCVDRVSYRTYHARDNLTRRIFIFRPNCDEFEMSVMIGLGFVIANDGDTENIPDQPVEQEVIEGVAS